MEGKFSKSFFYLENGEIKGPETVDDLLDLYLDSIIKADTMICLEGQDKWTPLSWETELYNYILEAVKETIGEEEEPRVQQSKLQMDTFNELMNIQESMQHIVTLPTIVSQIATDVIQQDESIVDSTTQAIPLIEDSQEEKDAKQRKKEERKLNKKRKKEKNKEKPIKKVKSEETGEWYDPKVNSNVYVTGLPPILTMEEFIEPFTKFGMLKIDLQSNAPRAKLYKNQYGSNKGDGIIYYLRPESVDLAIQFLENFEIKPGYPIQVQRAEFKKKENFIPEKKPPKPKIKDTRLNWQVDVGRVEETGEGIVILKHMFDLEGFAEDPLYEQSIKADTREECEKFGKIEKIRLFKRNPEGVIEIRFQNHAAAILCIQALNGRFFDGNKIEAEFWDGKTKYNQNEVELEDDEKRWEEFGKELNRKNEEEIQKLKEFDQLE